MTTFRAEFLRSALSIEKNGVPPNFGGFANFKVSDEAAACASCGSSPAPVIVGGSRLCAWCALESARRLISEATK